MQQPKWMIFDYGETLAHERDYRPGDGFAAIMEYAVSNPRNAGAEELLARFKEVYRELRLRVHAAGAEIPNMQRFRWLFEMYDLRFSLSPDELEEVFWNAAAPCEPAPGMPELLRRLRANGIGTGVISNMGFSGRCLTRRLDRLFPDHRFAFVISSADYVVRKPDPHIFELALKKAGCSAAEAWFMGDNPEADIAGAHGAGILPVYYDRDLGCAYREEIPLDPAIPCLRISDWSELFPIFPDK